MTYPNLAVPEDIDAIDELRVKDFVSCFCNKLGQLCGTGTPCGIPGLIDAIKKHDWAHVAALLIQGGVCTIAPPVIIAFCGVAFLQCIFGDEHQQPVELTIANFSHYMLRFSKNTYETSDGYLVWTGQ